MYTPRRVDAILLAQVITTLLGPWRIRYSTENGGASFFFFQPRPPHSLLADLVRARSHISSAPKSENTASKSSSPSLAAFHRGEYVKPSLAAFHRGEHSKPTSLRVDRPAARCFARWSVENCAGACAFGRGAESLTTLLRAVQLISPPSLGPHSCHQLSLAQIRSTAAASRLPPLVEEKKTAARAAADSTDGAQRVGVGCFRNSSSHGHGDAYFLGVCLAKSRRQQVRWRQQVLGSASDVDRA